MSEGGRPAQPASDERFRALIDASTQVLYRMSPDWSEMRQLGSTGFLAPTPEPTTSWLEKYIPVDARAEVRAAIEHAIATKSTFELEHQVVRQDGTIGWTLSRAVPVLDADGQVTEWFGAAADVTTRRRAEEELRRTVAEKETLLKEVHHRVKNNLQVVDSLLRLQADAFPDPRLREVVNETANRIDVIAAIHELLYQSADLARVDLDAFVRRLCRSLAAIHVDGARASRIETHVEPVTLDLPRAVPVGLIFNELISNALKHAFPAGRRGTIEIELRASGTMIVASVRDDGIGLPDPVPSGSLGLQLVRLLAEQLRGEARFERSTGTTVTLLFPLREPAAAAR
jgi:two-component sensor histidine kinase